LGLKYGRGIRPPRGLKLGRGMDEVKLVKRNEVDLYTLLTTILNQPGIEECGAIVTFTGIVRGVGHDNSKVLELQYEADEENAVNVLKSIRRKILEENPGVKQLLIYHVVDNLKPKDKILFILAAGRGRRDAFKAVEDALEAVKTKVPIWKKELTEKGAYWVKG